MKGPVAHGTPFDHDVQHWGSKFTSYDEIFFLSAPLDVDFDNVALRNHVYNVASSKPMRFAAMGCTVRPTYASSSGTNIVIPRGASMTSGQCTEEQTPQPLQRSHAINNSSACSVKSHKRYNFPTWPHSTSLFLGLMRRLLESIRVRKAWQRSCLVRQCRSHGACHRPQD